MFSKTCEYGIKATLFIASQSMKDTRVSLKQIAKEIASPVAFTAKIVQSLVKSELISSVKGPTGGYEIPESTRKTLTLSQIVIALDGPKLFTGCALGFDQCNDKKPCPAHARYMAIRSGITEMLNTTLISEMVNDMKKQNAVFKP